jgi:hypothetical protein
MNIRDYHAHPALSRSGVMKLLDCPQRYWFEYLSGQYIPSRSSAMITGSAVHTLLLEPDEFEKRFIVRKKTTTCSKKYQEYLLEAQDKEILFDTELEKAHACAESVKKNEFFKLTIGGSKIEETFIWQDEDIDIECKTRPDFYHPHKEFIVDIKTTDNCKVDEFAWSVARYGYHIQAAMALDGINKCLNGSFTDFVIIAVETDPPYVSTSFLIKPASILEGRALYKKGLQIYKHCVANNCWPGFLDLKNPSDFLQQIDIPRWAFKEEVL